MLTISPHHPPNTPHPPKPPPPLMAPEKHSFSPFLFVISFLCRSSRLSLKLIALIGLFFSLKIPILPAATPGFPGLKAFFFCAFYVFSNSSDWEASVVPFSSHPQSYSSSKNLFFSYLRRCLFFPTKGRCIKSFFLPESPRGRKNDPLPPPFFLTTFFELIPTRSDCFLPLHKRVF